MTCRAIAFHAGVWLLLAVTASAHHAFEAVYDPDNTTALSGVVTKVDWVNPHAYVFINVQKEDGTVATFSIELGPPYALVRGGWNRDTVKIGDSITMDNVALARNGNNEAGATRASTLILADGKEMVLR
jgi:hypothetical protein